MLGTEMTIDSNYQELFASHALGETNKIILNELSAKRKQRNFQR